MKKLGGFINEKGYLALDLFIDDKANEWNSNIKVVNTLSKEDRDSGKESIIAGSGRVVYTKDNLITAIPFKAN